MSAAVRLIPLLACAEVSHPLLKRRASLRARRVVRLFAGLPPTSRSHMSGAPVASVRDPLVREVVARLLKSLKHTHINKMAAPREAERPRNVDDAAVTPRGRGHHAPKAARTTRDDERLRTRRGRRPTRLKSAPAQGWSARVPKKRIRMLPRGDEKWTTTTFGERALQT